jgi:hypothetical protein
MPKLGPGTLTVGSTGAEVDASCQVNNARIAVSKDQGDSKTMLCGTVKPGATTYTYALSGNFDIDPENGDAGLFALSNVAKGTEVPFTFTPSTADGTTASGTLVIDPLDFGADDYGDYLNSDFEWSLVGDPAYVFGTTPPPGDAE